MQAFKRVLDLTSTGKELVSVLVSEKFRGLDLGLGLGRVGLDYSPGTQGSKLKFARLPETS